LGEGSVVYLASAAPEIFAAVVDRFLAPGRSWDVPSSVECIEWSGEESALAFLLNHGNDEAQIAVPEGDWIDLLTARDLDGEVRIQPRDVVVARRDR